MPESDGGGSGAEDKVRDRDLHQLRITFHYKEKQVERTEAETEREDSVFLIQQDAWKWARLARSPRCYWHLSSAAVLSTVNFVLKSQDGFTWNEGQE